MENVDWKTILAFMGVLGMYTHMVIEWIKIKYQLKQLRYYAGLDEDGNPQKDGNGKVKRQVDSDYVREIVRHEVKPTIKMPPREGESA